jgi:hypothetical protein
MQIKYELLFVFNILMDNWARHEFLVHQRMYANGSYCHMIYSPETDRKIKHRS